MQEPVCDRARRSPWSDPVLLALIAFGVALVPIFATGVGGSRTSWVLQTGIDVVSAVFAMRLARVTEGAGRRFWRVIVFATVSSAIGDSYQTFLVLTEPGSSGASIAQTSLVVAGMSAVVLVMLFHPLGGSGRQRLRLWLDTGTVLTGVAVFLWYFSLAPALTSADAGQRWAGAATSAVMLLIVFGLLKLVLGGTAPFTRVAGVIGIVGISGTAVGASALTVAVSDVSPRLVILAQLLPCLIVPISFRLQEAQTRLRVTSAAVREKRRSSRLPYLAVAATQVLLVVALVSRGADMRLLGVVVGTAVITGMVLSRQLAAFHDNERLLERLDTSMSEVRTQREWFRSLVQHTSDVTVALEEDGRVRYATPASGRVLGVDADDLIGRTLTDHLHPDDRPLVTDLLARLAAAPGVAGDTQLRMRHADGTYRWLDILGTDLTGNPAVAAVVLNARDITEARVLHDELRHQATHDALTGLANRMLLEERLRELPATSTVSLLLIDLDGFKPINDQYGHHAGDAVLTEVADRLRRAAGPDGLAARLGGDEFAILLPDTAGAAVTALAELLTESVTEPIAVGADLVTVGASVGVASGPRRESDRLLREADAAMYRIKAERKSTVHA